MPEEIKRIETVRPDWTSMFLIEALHWSQRSHDPQTKCGCVLVRDKTILSAGYNGFIRDVNDEVLPNTRPYKYHYMIHAEQNAIFNCTRHGISTLGATAYITSIPCTDCLQYMYQCGIISVIYSDFNNPNMCKNNEFIERFRLLEQLMHPKMNIQFLSKNNIYTQHLDQILLTLRDKNEKQE